MSHQPQYPTAPTPMDHGDFNFATIDPSFDQNCQASCAPPTSNFNPEFDHSSHFSTHANTQSNTQNSQPFNQSPPSFNPSVAPAAGRSGADPASRPHGLYPTLTAPNFDGNTVTRAGPVPSGNANTNFNAAPSFGVNDGYMPVGADDAFSASGQAFSGAGGAMNGQGGGLYPSI
jgi:hypothetical protein